MMKLTCKDLDAASTCEFEATGESASEVAGKMMTHAKAEHADKVTGMDDSAMMAMLQSKVHA